MMLTDTAPLVALIVPADAAHARCAAFAATLREPMLTTWPCLTETAHFLYRSGGWYRLEFLWQLVASGGLVVHHPVEAELSRVRELMVQYRDLPCDLADASLIAAAETRGLRRVFTLDRHFYAYRLNSGAAFEVLP